MYGYEITWKGLQITYIYRLPEKETLEISPNLLGGLIWAILYLDPIEGYMTFINFLKKKPLVVLLLGVHKASLSGFCLGGSQSLSKRVFVFGNMSLEFSFFFNPINVIENL